MYWLQEDIRRFRQGLVIRALTSLVGSILAGLMVFTEILAWHLGFSEVLGGQVFDAWFGLSTTLVGCAILAHGILRSRSFAGFWGFWILAVGGLLAFEVPLYWPWSGWHWKAAMVTGGFGGVVRVAEVAGGLVGMGGWVWVAVGLRREKEGVAEQAETQGSARFANAREVEEYFPRAGVVGGVALAGVRDKKGLRRIFDVGEGSVLVVAPPGAGKTTSVVLPTLLSWPGSIVAFEVKTELRRLTSGFRQDVLGQEVFFFQPLENCSRFNPLDLVPKGDLMVSRAQMVASALARQEEGGAQGNEFFEAAAQQLLVAAILHVLHVGPDRNLSGVLALLQRPCRDVITEMLTTIHDPEKGPGPLTEIVNSVGGYADAADTRLLESVFATAKTALEAWADPLLARATSATDFDPRTFSTTPQTLYISVPYEETRRLRRPFRMLLNVVLTSLASSEDRANRYPILVVLDDLVALGKIGWFLEDLVATYRGFGIRFLLVVQGKDQLKRNFGDNESISAMCSTREYFAPADLETGKMVSGELGKFTALRNQISASSPKLGTSFGGQRTVAEGEVPRDLLTADEAMRLPKDRVIVRRTNERAILGHKMPFYDDPELLRRSRLAPAKPEANRRLPSAFDGHEVFVKRLEAAKTPGAIERPEGKVMF